MILAFGFGLGIGISSVALIIFLSELFGEFNRSAFTGKDVE